MTKPELKKEIEKILEDNKNKDKQIKNLNNQNKILDEKDPISDAYILDVCSKEKGRE